MITQQTTKYKCDGCGCESDAPYGWRQVSHLAAGQTFTLVVGQKSHAFDMCSLCWSLAEEAMAKRRQAAA